MVHLMVIDVGKRRSVVVIVVTALVMQRRNRLLLIVDAHHSLIRLLTVYQFGDHLTVLLV